MSDNKYQIDVATILNSLDSKVERLHTRLDDVDKTLIKQEANLSEHIYRTTLAEKNIELLRKDVRHMETDISPIRKHVIIVENTLKVLGIMFGGMIALIGTVFTIIKIISYF